VEKTMEEELAMLKKVKMWELVDASIHIVGYKWVFKVKKDVVGNIFCYKACLVIQEFS